VNLKTKQKCVEK